MLTFDEALAYVRFSMIGNRARFFSVCLTVLFSAYAEAQTTSAGFTPAMFRVTESGAAEYRIPIQVSPGIAGMEPRLALAYNSQAGNGLLGVGWSLDGLSAIARCPRTMAQDGVRGAVNYDANDRYCLDGQRLMIVSGSYGADGAEYRTERESFSKIVSYGAAGSGPAWFKVWTKSGQILEYGNTADSRIEAQGKSSVRIWALNKAADTKGNSFTVTYAEDSANGDYRPERIDYAGASVQFAYATRPDSPPFYQAGSLIKSTTRLTNVKTYRETALVTDYQLAYAQAAGTERSTLTSVKQCRADATCLPAHTFTWSSGDTAPLTVGPWSSPFNDKAAASNWHYQWHDINGDGRADLVFTYQDGNGMIAVQVAFSNPDGTLTIGPWSSPFASGMIPSAWHYSWNDVNGDGKADLVFTYQDRNGGGLIAVQVAFSNGDGTFAVGPWSSPFNDKGYPAWQYSWKDVNGDGRADLVFTYQDASGYIAIHPVFSNGDGTFTVGPWSSPFASGMIPSAWRYSWNDVNGDGKSDLVFTYQDNGGYIAVQPVFSNGDGTFTVGPWSSPFASGMAASYGWNYSWNDVNGDGKADLVFTYQDGSGYIAIHPVFSKGDGTFILGPWTSPFASGMIPSGWRYSWNDMNGDGKADLVFTYQDNSGLIAVQPVFSKGDGTFTVGPWSSPFPSGMIPWAWHYSWNDRNGDGKADLVFTYQDNGGGGLIAVQSVSSAPVPLVIQAIDNGAGATRSVTYLPLGSGGALYAKDTNAVYPQVDLQGALYVVQSAVESNGIAGTSATTYAYGGAKMEANGRGFLGFRWQEATLPSSTKSRTEFRQDWPYVGLPSLAKQTQSSGALLSRVTNTYGCTNPATGASCTVAAGNRYFPYASQRVETSSDLNGASLPTVTTTTTYDTHGNATSVVVSTGDGFSKTTSNIFTNDVPNWILGRLTRSTVQSTAP